MQLKVVFTGPESSGKTTLAQAMAQNAGSRYTPEFARPYLASLGRPYTYNDLPVMARGQQAWENWYALNSQTPVLFCDTDWTVIYVWEQFKFGTTELFPQRRPEANTHYFLCSPDIPWQPDPLREHPASRSDLFSLYEQLLQKSGASYQVVEGSLTERLQFIQQSIHKLL